MGRLSVSVVIPTLDEADRLPLLLRRLAVLGVDDVLVVDGGSTDHTLDVARGLARVMTAARGRGSQLAAGAAAVAGDVVWFLHADANPPDGAPDAIRAALADPTVVGGAFWLRTVDDGPVPVGPLLRLADVRSRFAHYPYGDQGIFARRSALGVCGVPTLPLMEDLELSRRLARLGRMVTLHTEIRVSGRRFAAGRWRAAGLMWLFPTLWRLGVPADRLARVYRVVR